MESKESFSDRLDQAFNIFFSNSRLLLTISGIYALIYVLSVVSSKILVSYFIFDNNDFFYNVTNLYVIGIFHILYLVMVIVYVGVYLGLIKTISDIYNSKPTKFLANIKYGFGNIINSFATYYHIFMYVYFIPSILLILGLGLILIDLINNKIGITTINGGYFNGKNIPDFSHVQWFFVGLGLIFLSIFLGIYFLIYRGIKSSFAIFHAIDCRDFSQESFRFSIKLTKNKWWRILGNTLIFFIIIGIIFSILNAIFSLFNGYMYKNEIDYTRIKSINPLLIKSFIDSMFNIDIGSFLQSALSGLQTYIGIIFIYLFYKRLQKEDGGQVWIDNGSQDILKQGYTSLGTEDL